MSDKQALLDSIAYVAWHRQELRVEEPGRAVVVQPDRADLRNYFGTVHAGAIYTLAETAAGVVADGVARPLGGFILLGAAELRYTRRAEGALEAAARIDPGTDGAALAREFAGAGRGALAVAVAIRDPGGETVFEGTFHYAMRRRRQ
ncbi:MAG: PaaI family thioesterase [Burkholderiaceae bacterium]|nr:PaaI family thioesterase [Burkholderiaceae bacterium]